MLVNDASSYFLKEIVSADALAALMEWVCRLLQQSLQMRATGDQILSRRTWQTSGHIHDIESGFDIDMTEHIQPVTGKFRPGAFLPSELMTALSWARAASTSISQFPKYLQLKQK